MSTGLMMPAKQTFKQKILQIVSQIPRGKVLSYKEVARLANRPKAYRAVGNILCANHNPKIPCHRVVGSDGKMRGYNKGIKNKILLLKREGIKIVNNKCRDFKNYNSTIIPPYTSLSAKARQSLE